MPQLSDADAEDLRMRFARVDIDKDGVIDAADFARLCRKLSPSGSAEDVSRAVRHVTSIRKESARADVATLDDFIAVATSLREGTPIPSPEMSPRRADSSSDGPARQGSARAAYLAAVASASGAGSSGASMSGVSGTSRVGTLGAGAQEPNAAARKPLRAVGASCAPSADPKASVCASLRPASSVSSTPSTRSLGSPAAAQAPKSDSRRPSLATITVDASAAPRSGKVTRIAGATGSSQHSLEDDEIEQFAMHINSALAGDTHVGSLLPIEPSADDGHASFFHACRDGLVLAKLVNLAVPGTIDERVLNIPAPSTALNAYQMTENNNVAINSAKAIGCSVVNIGAQDLIDGREHLVLGLVWQVIKRGLLAKVSLQEHPELFRLLAPGETLAQLLALPPDELLLRWVNYHLAAAGCSRRIANFAGDIRDSEAYAVLLGQLSPGCVDVSAVRSESDMSRRAEHVLAGAATLGCCKYASVRAIVTGNPRLNLAFVANLFNEHPGLAELSTAERATLDEGLFAAVGDREARAFALWLNSLGVEPAVYSLYDDLRDGRLLLQAIDKVVPGSVSWRRANTSDMPLSRFRAIENTNYAVELCRAPPLSLSLVGTQGADITDGSRTLALGIVWQLMRAHISETLRALGDTAGSDEAILAWANGMVPSSRRVSGLRDSSLATGLFLLDLVEAMRPGVVDREIVLTAAADDAGDEDASEDWRTSNAKYAISIARKLGATIFLLPEDVVEVRPKMLLTLLGTLKAVHLRSQS